MISMENGEERKNLYHGAEYRQSYMAQADIQPIADAQYIYIDENNNNNKINETLIITIVKANDFTIHLTIAALHDPDLTGAGQK